MIRCMRGTLHYLPSEVLDIVHSLYGLHLHDAASVGKWEKSFKVRAAELEALQRPILDVCNNGVRSFLLECIKCIFRLYGSFGMRDIGRSLSFASVE